MQFFEILRRQVFDIGTARCAELTNPSRSRANKASRTGTRLTPNSLAAADSASSAPGSRTPSMMRLRRTSEA